MGRLECAKDAIPNILNDKLCLKCRQLVFFYNNNIFMQINGFYEMGKYRKGKRYFDVFKEEEIMVIQHNLLALNANRQLGIVKSNLSKSTEKLSSGYKINRAADDAAGLSISEKMRKQIRGLSQAAENIQDGISLCQVADGALNETVDILQRMNELAIQAANGTNSTTDRQDIQLEIDQLSSEINRIANSTKFNEIYPLLGKTEMLTETGAISSNGYRWTLPNTLKEATVEFGNMRDASGNYQSGFVNGQSIVGSQIVQATFIYDETVAGKKC